MTSNLATDIQIIGIMGWANLTQEYEVVRGQSETS